MPGSTSPPPTYSGANPMPTSFNIAGVFKHAIDLVKSPASVMTAYRDSDPSFNSLMINYVVILAAIPFVATLIGDLWYYFLFGFAITAAILYYILGIVAVVVAGYVLAWLGPNFGTKTTTIRATRLAAYVFTPYFLASILLIIPFVGDLAYLGLLYGLYILYLGAPIMLGTPKDKVLTYVIVAAIAVFIITAVIDTIAFYATAAAFLHVLAV